ncbi:caspase family protein [Ectothiorhodospira shaposhnikovii]|uniref:caspase family protein n=1 Tax=Ectothiorhodospira shaposhnikovii TaxID=1054 RepID=UPI001EE86BAE|nr:caspase family protein [Ectothiorhodospira shaposhnikovii]MCG5511953.1 caspase family protein [Ectothiorhodospira shaposhnikovii]
MSSREPGDYAIVVGIDAYPRYGANGRHLRGAVRDAKRFYQWLLNQDTGGGLDSDNCRLITSEQNPMALTQTTVDLALDDLWARARNAGGGRRFYFFFSGHGQSVVGSDATTYDQSFCLPQWSQTMPHAALNADSYPRVVQTCMPFREIVMFLDCCRVPAIKVRAMNSSVGCHAPLEGFEQVECMAYFAAEPMRRAFEGSVQTEDDQATDVHGFFSTALMEALQKGSSRPGGGIGAEALWQYLEYRVPQLADENGRRQIPQRVPLRFSDTVVFGAAGQATAPEAENFEIRFSAARQGPVRLFDASATEMRAGNPSEASWRVRLEPGETYLLIDEGSGQRRVFVFLADMEGTHDTF